MSIDASILEEFGAGYTPPVDGKSEVELQVQDIDESESKNVV